MEMSPTNIAFVLCFSFIKPATCGKGYVKEIYINKKFYCEAASKGSFIVSSKIQCIHYCIRKNCSLINYLTKEDGKVNCEVLFTTHECSTVGNEESWIALTIELERPTAGTEYIGCYNDHWKRALPSQQSLNINLGSLTQQCIDKCRLLNHPYAGLQFHNHCFCGTTYDKHGKADEALCNIRCTDSSEKFCGGVWKNSVYKICNT